MSLSISETDFSFKKISKEDPFLGFLGSVGSISGGYFTIKATGPIMRNWGLRVEESHTFFRLYDSLEGITNTFFRSIFKAISIVYVVLIIPVVEEWFFRDVVYKWQLSENSQAEKKEAKIYRVVSNGVIFGAFHLNPLRGWVNVPIFIVSTISGIIFAFLREITQSRWASTIAHSLNNTFVLLITFLKI